MTSECLYHLCDWTNSAWKPLHYTHVLSHSPHICLAVGPVGFYLNGYSTLKVVPSPRKLGRLNYAADLPHRASGLVCMNSERRGQGSNQVQALYIDFLKVLLFFYCRQVPAKGFAWHLVIWVYWSSRTVTAKGCVVIALVRFHHRKFCTVLWNENVSDFVSRAGSD